MLPGQLAVGFFDVVGGCGTAYAQHMVQVFLCHLSSGLFGWDFPDFACGNFTQ
jgi:hypothetical protein